MCSNNVFINTRNCVPFPVERYVYSYPTRRLNVTTMLNAHSLFHRGIVTSLSNMGVTNCDAFGDQENAPTYFVPVLVREGRRVVFCNTNVGSFVNTSLCMFVASYRQFVCRKSYRITNVVGSVSTKEDVCPMVVPVIMDVPYVSGCFGNVVWTLRVIGYYRPNSRSRLLSFRDVIIK